MSSIALTVSLLTVQLVAAPVPTEKSDSLFDNVVKALEKKYVDKEFCKTQLPRFVELYRPLADAAATLEEQRDVVQDFLTNIPSSHMCLIADESHGRMFGELAGRTEPTFGFEVVELDGKYFAHNVLEGGPADVAGLRRGDRIVTVNGELLSRSGRLGWRTDDAFLPDPPTHFLNGEADEVLKLNVERTPGSYEDIEVPMAPYSAWAATKTSARIFEQDGKRIGYIHYWFIYLKDADKLLKELLENEFADCDALVLDLRGRGGSGFMIGKMLDVLSGETSNWQRPVVGLINVYSRSAKEVFANEFRKLDLGLLVGEKTAGAVIPVSLSDVGHGMKLMVPSFGMGKHTQDLELVGIAPDVVVEEVGPYSAGADPILERGLVEAAGLAALRGDTVAVKRSAPKTNTMGARVISAGPSSGDGASGLSLHADATADSKDQEKTAYVKVDIPVDEILGRMVDALGGEEVMRRHSTRTLRGKMDMGHMFEATHLVQAAAPNLFLMRGEIDGMGRMESGFNGTVGWQLSPMSDSKMLEGDELEEMKLDAEYYDMLHMKSRHESIELLGQTTFNKQASFEIKLTRKDGKEETLFVDAKSFLPIGRKGEVDTNMGSMEMITYIEAYKEYDGEQIAVRERRDIGGMQEQIITISEVSFDALPADTFNPPDELKALAQVD